jgi:hypothetical protein
MVNTIIQSNERFEAKQSLHPPPQPQNGEFPVSDIPGSILVNICIISNYQRLRSI